MKTNDNYEGTEQKIFLQSQDYEPCYDKKQARIELRALKDALPLNVVHGTTQKTHYTEDIDLKKVTAHCISDRLHLKNLSKFLQNNDKSRKTAMYYGECLYSSVSAFDKQGNPTENDVFYFDYGVVVIWGLDERSEAQIIKDLSIFMEGKFKKENIESEYFSYGVVQENPRVTNDIIYLNTDDYFSKMVLANPIAQSVKLDFFEKIVDDTIENVRDLPEEIESEGRVGKSRKEVLKLIGRLHRLRFNLNLISNILDEPEILWHHPEHANLYQTFNHYLEIKPRTAVLNQRCDIIQSILEILTDNISTRNSESLEKTIIFLNAGTLLLNIVMIIVLMFKKFN